jgi:hypothetical protein
VSRARWVEPSAWLPACGALTDWPGTHCKSAPGHPGAHVPGAVLASSKSRPTLAEQEVLANLLRTGVAGNARVMSACERKGWATYDVGTGKQAITDVGHRVLREAAAR